MAASAITIFKSKSKKTKLNWLNCFRVKSIGTLQDTKCVSLFMRCKRKAVTGSAISIAMREYAVEKYLYRVQNRFSKCLSEDVYLTSFPGGYSKTTNDEPNLSADSLLVSMLERKLPTVDISF